MGDLVEFLTARLDEDEWWAREASRIRKQEGQPAGDHWQWVNSDSDQVLVLDPSQYEYVGDEAGGAVQVSLRSREKYPTETVGDLPNFAISSAEEVPTTVAGHIARHDPARILREVEAKRRIIKEHFGFLVPKDGSRACRICSDRRAADGDPLGFDDGRWLRLEPSPCPTLRLLALPYETHPDYREEFRP